MNFAGILVNQIRDKKKKLLQTGKTMQDMRVKDQILKITSTDYFTAITYAAFEHKAYTCI